MGRFMDMTASESLNFILSPRSNGAVRAVYRRIEGFVPCVARDESFGLYEKAAIEFRRDFVEL